MSQTYFVVDEHGGLIKIGRSANAQARIEAIAKRSRLKLQLLIVLEYDVEIFLHTLLGRYRREGEWFELTPELIGGAITSALKAIAIQKSGRSVQEISEGISALMREGILGLPEPIKQAE